MKNNKTLQRFLALLLCAAMMITYMPSPVYTLAEEQINDQPVAEEVVEQAESEAEPAAEEKPQVEEKVTEPEPEEKPQAEEKVTEQVKSEAEPAAEEKPQTEEKVTEPEPEEKPQAQTAGSESENAEAQPAEKQGSEDGTPPEATVEDASNTKEDSENKTVEKKFEKTSNNGITVVVDGIFPEGVELMTVEPVDAGKVLNALGENEGAKAVRIAFQDKDGAKVDPEGKLSVSVDATGLEEGKTYKVFYNENGKKEANLGEEFKTDALMFAVVCVDEDEEVENKFRKINDSEYEIAGDMNISDMLDLIDKDIRYIDTDSKSVGGWVAEKIGDIPARNDKFNYKDMTVTVKDVEEQRINTVIVNLKSQNKNRKEKSD